MHKRRLIYEIDRRDLFALQNALSVWPCMCLFLENIFLIHAAYTGVCFFISKDTS